MTVLILCWLSLLLGLAVGYGLAALTRRPSPPSVLEIRYQSTTHPAQGGQPKPAWPYWEICKN
jgi:hypothetical protein